MDYTISIDGGVKMVKDNLPEKTVSTKDIYTGKIICVKVSTVEIKDQRYSQREIVTHPGGACIAAVNENNKIILVKQFRKAIEEFTIELPAGKLELGEEPKDCIKRELKEETGYVLTELRMIYQMYPSPGISNEKLYMYFGKVMLKDSPKDLDDEIHEVLEVTIDEALNMVKSGQISDAKTINGIYWLKVNYFD